MFVEQPCLDSVVKEMLIVSLLLLLLLLLFLLPLLSLLFQLQFHLQFHLLQFWFVVWKDIDFVAQFLQKVSAPHLMQVQDSAESAESVESEFVESAVSVASVMESGVPQVALPLERQQGDRRWQRSGAASGARRGRGPGRRRRRGQARGAPGARR